MCELWNQPEFLRNTLHGLTALLEYLDSSLKTEDDVVQALMLPVLALIPLMSAEGQATGRMPRSLGSRWVR